MKRYMAWWSTLRSEGCETKTLVGLNSPQVRLEVAEDLLAFVRRAGTIGVGIGHFGDLGQHALERRAVGPVPVPDGQRAEIGIAEKGELMRVHAEDFGGGHGFVVTDFAHQPNRFRASRRYACDRGRTTIRCCRRR